MAISLSSSPNSAGERSARRRIQCQFADMTKFENAFRYFLGGL
jgi:hypothetical protein